MIFCQKGVIFDDCLEFNDGVPSRLGLDGDEFARIREGLVLKNVFKGSSNVLQSADALFVDVPNDFPGIDVVILFDL